MISLIAATLPSSEDCADVFHMKKITMEIIFFRVLTGKQQYHWKY